MPGSYRSSTTKSTWFLFRIDDKHNPVKIGVVAPDNTSVGEPVVEKVEILRETGVGIIGQPSEFGNAVTEVLAKL